MKERSSRYGIAADDLPVLGFAPELNLNRLCPTGSGRNMLNDVLTTPFVAILSRFVEGPDRDIRRDARICAGFAKGKGTNTELAKIFCGALDPINGLWSSPKR